MITRITGVLNRVLDEELRLQVGAFEYQVLVPEFVRRLVQNKVGQEVTLHTSNFFEGNPMQGGKMVPRLLGFLTETDLEFFDLFCTVDGVGTRKAMKALVRASKDVADAIQRQDAKWLTTLPGVGRATADKIVATLQRKVTRFALVPAAREEATGEVVAPTIEGSLLEDVYNALVSIGHSPAEARSRLDKVLATGRTFQSVQEVLTEIYKL